MYRFFAYENVIKMFKFNRIYNFIKDILDIIEYIFNGKEWIIERLCALFPLIKHTISCIKHKIYNNI